MNKTRYMNDIRFKNKAHKDFYAQMLAKAKNDDSYHRAFFYTMGICEETRRNINTLFDFTDDCINQERLYSAWQTGGTNRLCRLAFNLWNGWTEEGNEQAFTPYGLFDCAFSISMSST